MIADFLKLMKSVVDRSYQLEFAGVDAATGAGRDSSIFGDAKDTLVVRRAALFTELKDGYDLLGDDAKRTINKFVHSKHPNSDTFTHFIDTKVAGVDGKGGCLQDATYTLLELHNALVRGLGFEDECEILNPSVERYRVMPKLEENTSEHFKEFKKKMSENNPRNNLENSNTNNNTP